MYKEINLSNLDNTELMNLYASVLGELYSRKVTRTFNSPVGDYAEWIFASINNLELEANSKKGYDAIDTNNIKDQIKSRWFNPVRGSRQLNVIRNYEKKEFDYLIAMFFKKNFEIMEAYKIPHEVVKDYGRYSKYQNGYILTVDKNVINDIRVNDITNEF